MIPRRNLNVALFFLLTFSTQLTILCLTHRAPQNGNQDQNKLKYYAGIILKDLTQPIHNRSIYVNSIDHFLSSMTASILVGWGYRLLGSNAELDGDDITCGVYYLIPNTHRDSAP